MKIHVEILKRGFLLRVREYDWCTAHHVWFDLVLLWKSLDPVW